MPTPGEEVRQARLAQGLSQEQLAQRAGVSARTIGRVERGQDYDDPRTLPVVRAALGLDDDPHDLTKVPAEALAAELVRRLVAAERILEQARVRKGDAPANLIDQPDVLRGPQQEQGSDADSADG